MDDLELSELDQRIAAFVPRTPAPGRHSARNAILGIKKAWNLRKVDPEMAVFRGITADEESATAIFHALRSRKYKHADRLHPYRHTHKAAVVPFLAAVEHSLSGMNVLEPSLRLRKTYKRPCVALRFTLTDAEGRKFNADPIPPLHGIVSVDDQLLDFKDILQDIATRQKARDIQKHIDRLSNERNKLLYASTNGVPGIVDLKDEFFFATRHRIFRNLATYLLISEYRTHQDFVQQCLDAFLKMLNALPKDGRG